ncbi:MAG TPA: anti-sigma factor [Trebonia sp.]|jgi:anti-sigma-K factor RskA
MVQSHELHLLTGSYALDALPADEQADFEKHLTRCRSCAEEVRGLRETAARLGMATAVTPPPEMRARVLAAVPRTRQLPPPGRNRLSRSGLRRLPLSRAGLTAGIMALAAAVAFLLVTQVSTSHRLNQEQANSRAIAAVLAAPDARIESLPATKGGTVTAVLSVRQREAVVTSANLPALSGARVYQLWVMTSSGKARSVGLLTVSISGSASPVLAGGVLPGDQLGITVEPAGGTAQPTTTPVIVMPVTA